MSLILASALEWGDGQEEQEQGLLDCHTLLQRQTSLSYDTEVCQRNCELSDRRSSSAKH